MLKRSIGRSWVAVLVVLAGTISVTVSVTSASAREASRVSLGEASRSSDALMREARWVTLDGRRVLAAPLSAAGTGPVASSLFSWASLRNAGTGLCLSSYPDEKGHGVEQWPCNGSYNQNWMLVRLGAGWGLVSEGMVVNNSQGTVSGCLDNRGGEVFTNGNAQIMWPCYGDGWNLGLTYFYGLAQKPGTILIHTNDWAYHDGKTWCVTSYPNKSWGSTMAEWACNKYSPDQSFYPKST
jgi:Ricin-type beta-trefoil lectin domain-like